MKNRSYKFGFTVAIFAVTGFLTLNSARVIHILGIYGLFMVILLWLLCLAGIYWLRHH